jgi:DNA-binding HxlR family transcriptional regulator
MKQEVTKRLLVKRSGDMNRHQQCSVIATLKLFATRWKPCILCYLSEKPMRYNELFRIIPNISRKMLSAHLKEMENDKLIIRSQYDEKLQKVEYALSEKGRSLMPILYQLEDWGMNRLENVLSIKEMVDINVVTAS